MANKVMSMEQALDLIQSGMTIANAGFGMSGVAEEVLVKLEERFLTTGAPKDLNLVYAAGQGDWAGAGNDHFAHEGFLKSVTGGHFGTCVALGELVAQNKVEGYNLPQGAIAHMYRSCVMNEPGHITKVGLKTYIDPRIEGGKMNSISKKDWMEVITIKGEEYLMYEKPQLDIGFLRGTLADTDGNISIEEEILPLDLKLVAMAVKACGGKVIAQVKQVVPAGSLMTDRVAIPGIFIDAVVVCSDPMKYHKQTMVTFYDQTMSGHAFVPAAGMKPMALDAKKVICRRSAMELVPNALVNLGIGTPEFVAAVAAEEGCGADVILTAESGVIGGIPCSGKDFGASRNAMGTVDQITQFDFYDGNGLDVTYLGLAQTNQKGDVNVSKFGPKIAGCGGFINISQNTKNLVYCGTFTAGGLKETFGDGKMSIVQEGKAKKFIKEVEQVTFSGEFGVESGQNVLYVTERAVFKLTDKGVTLIEIAPGADLQKDILDQMEFTPAIAEPLKLMDEKLFRDEPFGLKEILDAKAK